MNKLRDVMKRKLRDVMKRRADSKIKEDPNIVIPFDITFLSSSFIRSCHTIPKKGRIIILLKFRVVCF